MHLASLHGRGRAWVPAATRIEPLTAAVPACLPGIALHRGQRHAALAWAPAHVQAGTRAKRQRKQAGIRRWRYRLGRADRKQIGGS